MFAKAPEKGFLLEKLANAITGIDNHLDFFMMRVQRKYKVLKAKTTKEITELVNELIQREYKDTEGFIFQSSGRWQCLGGILFSEREERWLQTMVFIQEEEN